MSYKIFKFKHVVFLYILQQAKKEQYKGATNLH